MLISVENINTALAPRILKDSVLDINGSRYKCTQAEGMTNTAATGQNYIYAVPNGNTASFCYGAEPQWDPAKGGWYREISGKYCRAIVKVFVTNGQYNNKIILDNYNAMFAVNTKQPISSITAAGVPKPIQSYINGTPFDDEIDLPPGIYRYSLKGGDGGAGGRGGEGGKSYILPINLSISASDNNLWSKKDAAIGGTGYKGASSYHIVFTDMGNTQTTVIDEEGQPGSPGGDPKTTTSGHAQLWQVG